MSTGIAVAEERKLTWSNPEVEKQQRDDRLLQANLAQRTGKPESAGRPTRNATTQGRRSAKPARPSAR